MKLGLHNHSNYSDGLYSVKSILNLADEVGLDVVSITDHNEIRGSLKAYELKDSYKVDVLLGMELFFWYNKKITELLVYFREPQEIIGFYKEFIGSSFIPTVKEPKDLERLVKKYSGLAIMPHPKAQKGCIKNNFKYPTKNIEAINYMTRQDISGNGRRDFGGGDLHFYKDSLSTYSELVGGKELDDIFDDNFTVKAVSNSRLSLIKKIWQRAMIVPLDIRYLLIQILKRKLFKKAL